MIQGTLSLVLPAHNEADNVTPVIERALSILPRFVEEFEIVLVDDGSTDETGEIACRLAGKHPKVRVVTHTQNRGYGAALRSGFQATTGDWVMVMDSDRQFDIADLAYLAPLIEEYDLVAGYRMLRSDPAHRVLFGKTFRLAMKVLFGIQLYDIDCAFKVIRGDLLRSLNLESEGALISTELMARWARTGASWTQVGVHHYPRPAGQQSGGSLRVIARAMRDVPVLWYRLNREPRRLEINDTRGPSSGVSIAQATIIVSAILTLVAGVVAKVVRRR